MGWVCTKYLVQFFDFIQNLSHFHNRVYAEIGARAVRGFANGLNLKPDKASMGADQLKLRELGYDRAIRLEAFCKIHCAKAGIFLVDDPSKNNVASQALFPRLSDCQHTGRD